jgi:hypothetical protein
MIYTMVIICKSITRVDYVSLKIDDLLSMEPWAAAKKALS